ncbi:MAG: GntR family transcriptional regulator [Nitriliruptoraceae bacterium]|nr:GntR family transcriptional regulator [Nitriliruptoraceae bacterium]
MTEMATPPSRRRSAYDTHYEQAKQDLEALAAKLAAAGEARLPAEDRLAEEIGFSRPTVRSALLAMQKEGKVLRLHGVGTFINRHALDIRANLAEDLPFLQVIENLGFEPSFDIVRLAQDRLPDEVAARCGAPTSSDGLIIAPVLRASGRAAVLSPDHIPLDNIHAPVQELTAERSTFAFMRRWTGQTIRYSVARIRAIIAPADVEAALGLPASSPVLLLDHQHIDGNDRELGVTHSYIRDGIIDFSMVRTGKDV